MADEGEAGVEKEIALGVFVDRARHRAHHREVVGTVFPQMWEEVGDGESALAAGGEVEGAAVDVPVVVELGPLDLHRHRFAMEFAQLRFRIEGVEVRDTARHVTEDDILRAWAEMWARRSDVGSEGLRAEQS